MSFVDIFMTSEIALEYRTNLCFIRFWYNWQDTFVTVSLAFIFFLFHFSISEGKREKAIMIFSPMFDFQFHISPSSFNWYKLEWWAVNDQKKKTILKCMRKSKSPRWSAIVASCLNKLKQFDYNKWLNTSKFVEIKCYIQPERRSYGTFSFLWQEFTFISIVFHSILFYSISFCLFFVVIYVKNFLSVGQ